MDGMGSPLPSRGQVWSTQAYYVDGAQSHPTGDEAFIQRIQAAPKRVMFQENDDRKVQVKTLSSDKIDGVVHCMKDGMHDSVVIN